MGADGVRSGRDGEPARGGRPSRHCGLCRGRSPAPPGGGVHWLDPSGAPGAARGGAGGARPRAIGWIGMRRNHDHLVTGGGCDPAAARLGSAAVAAWPRPGGVAARKGPARAWTGARDSDRKRAMRITLCLLAVLCLRLFGHGAEPVAVRLQRHPWWRAESAGCAAAHGRTSAGCRAGCPGAGRLRRAGRPRRCRPTADGGAVRCDQPRRHRHRA